MLNIYKRKSECNFFKSDTTRLTEVERKGVTLAAAAASQAGVH